MAVRWIDAAASGTCRECHGRFAPEFTGQTVCRPCFDDPHRPDPFWSPRAAWAAMTAGRDRILREMGR